MDMVSGKVVQGCSNAGNPYHECTPICFERLSSPSDIIPKKEKHFFGFGRRTPTRDTPPGSPGSKSPLASYFAKKKVQSSSDNTSPSTDHTNVNFFSRLSPLNEPNNNESTNNVCSLPMSPTLSGYSGGDFFARRANHYGADDDNGDMSPRPFGTHPKTPEHPLRTPKHRPLTPQRHSDTMHQHDPISLDSRPRTPIHESAATSRRPQTPETRQRPAQHRGRSHEFKVRSSEPRSKTPEPQPTYYEPVSKTPKQRSKTPEPSFRIPQTQPISHRSLDSAALLETRPKTPQHQTRTTMQRKPIVHESVPKIAVYRGRSTDHMEKISQTQQTQISCQAYNYIGSKAEAVYIENDDESVLLYPELIFSPQGMPLSKPITPSRRGYETPTKQEEHFDQLDESASSDDDKFSFVDDHEDNSVWLYPETTPKSGSNTPVHHKSRKPPSKQEVLGDIQNNEPPELPDESHSFNHMEISCMKAIVVKKNETGHELQSVLSEESTIVTVGDYKVRASISATLKQILDKHGDIASASKLHSLATRSYYLDMLASVVFELQTTKLKHLKESRVVEMIAIVSDVESVKIKANWLKTALEEIFEAVKHYEQHKSSIMEKEGYEGDVLLARQEMEKQVKELKEKEKKLKEWRERTTEIAGKLGTLSMRSERLDKSLAFMSSKVDKFHGKSILQGIL
ncbi:unnamed protein product [Cochlearia groenlandica]